ncbi:ADP-ribosylglycohydrolase family protein [Cupriavidus metallidurans]|uniref:ADP-ribosylglycohydrolase family protein n=1 Tax=Cupriavidus metallidurans TaxID=119219 RepID=UPI001F3916CB|nr:ADP-ribosylglycohydrolase family protein [Cupriavidus metallidurans]
MLDTIWSARRALEASTFEDVVRAAIQFGNDTDTTACVAGGLAGIRFGLEGIPVRWLKQLRGYDVAAPLISALLEKNPQTHDSRHDGAVGTHARK